MIKFSFLMAAYNSEKYITEAVDSVLQQSYSNWELIIVDDGSVDNTAKIIDDYSMRDSRIKVIHQEKSGTAAAARNAGLDYVNGDYVHILDSDDLIDINLLNSYIEKLNESNLDILVPNCRCFQNDKINDIYWEKKAPQNNYNQIIDGEKAFDMSLTWIIHGLFLVKREIIQNIKFDSQFINGDEFTTRKLLFNAKKIGFVDSFYYYRLNMNSTTKKSLNKYRMYESLYTDINIYKYAVDCKMNKKTIEKSSNLLIKSFCGHCVMYYKEMLPMDKREAKEKAYLILKRTFLFITHSMWDKAPIKYRFFYLLSENNFYVFMREMKIVSVIRRI